MIMAAISAMKAKMKMMIAMSTAISIIMKTNENNINNEKRENIIRRKAAAKKNERNEK